jgi:hypothetical protein
MGNVFSAPHYLQLNAAILMVGVLFLLWKRPDRGIRLRLKGGSRFAPDKLPPRGIVIKHQKKSNVPAITKPDTLNVHFMYNGHSFDAYEVFGLPAGSSWEKVDQSYKAMASRPGAQDRAFLDAALGALKVHLRAG